MKLNATLMCQDVSALGCLWEAIEARSLKDGITEK